MAAAGGWVLQTATRGATEVLDTPFEVGAGQDAPVMLTMTDRVTEITGTLLDQLGRPAPEYSVVGVFCGSLALGHGAADASAVSSSSRQTAAIACRGFHRATTSCAWSRTSTRHS